MDTPYSNGSPNSEFEDSPVFSYISSLSPIKPVKSRHTIQTFNSLTLSSLPSVFTSPHASSQKEWRFLGRHQHSDQSKLEFTCEKSPKVCTVQIYDNTAELQQSFDPGVSFRETSAALHSEHPQFPIELPRGLKYDCGSPDSGPAACSSEKKCVSEMAVTLAASDVRKAFEKASSESAVHLQNMCQIVPKKEGMACDWENLISDDDDLLIFKPTGGDTEAFKGLIQKPLDPETRFGTSITSGFPQNDSNNVQNMLLINREPCGDQHRKDISSSQYGDACKLEERDQTQDLASTNMNECMASNLIQNMDDEPLFNLHHGVRRRCLDFEMVGARKKNLNNVSNCSSSMLSQSDEKIASKNKQLVPTNTDCGSSQYILPGIGLHLNALALKEYRSLKQEILSAGRQIINFPCLPSNFNSPLECQPPFHKSMSPASSERDTDPAENTALLAEDASQSSSYLLTEEYNQNNPKNKRKRFELAEESESCKRCNCKKSKCLKLYCECFAAGVYCTEQCLCQDCFNKPIHEDTVLATRKQIESRNPLAFAPKVIRSSDSVPEIGDESSTTPTSARHKRGCNCKKSSCLKKYCECYQVGVGCSTNCKCEGCQNAFGRKDDSALPETEAEQEEETDTCKESVVDKAMQKTEIQKIEEHNSASTLVAMPLQFSRTSVHFPFQSTSKETQPSFPTIGPAFGLYSSQIMGRPNILPPQSKFEDEFPEILQGNCSPATIIKTASPNSKRVSPPQNNYGSSPSQSSGRKLILKSIPLFPSLSPHH